MSGQQTLALCPHQGCFPKFQRLLHCLGPQGIATPPPRRICHLHHPVFSSDDIHCFLLCIRNEGVCNLIDTTIAPEKKLSIKDVRKVVNDHSLFAPTTKWDNSPIIAGEQEDQPFLDWQPIDLVEHSQQKHLKKKVQATQAPTKEDMDMTTPFLDTHTPKAMS